MQSAPQFILPSELFVAMQYIFDNYNDISNKIRVQLDYIAQTMINAYGSESEKVTHLALIHSAKSEEKHEFPQLEGLQPEIFIKIYIDTVNVLFPKAHLVLCTMTRKGTLWVRSQTLKLWGERNVELNYGRRIFIVKKSTNRKPDKELDITTYVLRWLGEIKSRYCFSLESKTTKNHYKCFFMGLENIELAKEWHEHIRIAISSCYISSFIEQRNKLDKLKRSLSPQKKELHSGNHHQNKSAKTFKQIKEEFEKKGAFDSHDDKKLKIPLDSSDYFEEEDKKCYSAPSNHGAIVFFDPIDSSNRNENGQSPTFKMLNEVRLDKYGFSDLLNAIEKNLRCLKSKKIVFLAKKKKINKILTRKIKIGKNIKKMKIKSKVIKFVKTEKIDFFSNKKIRLVKNIKKPRKIIQFVKYEKIEYAFNIKDFENSVYKLSSCRNLKIKSKRIFYEESESPDFYRNANEYQIIFIFYPIHFLSLKNLRLNINHEIYKLFSNSEENIYKLLIRMHEPHKEVIEMLINTESLKVFSNKSTTIKEISINLIKNAIILYEEIKISEKKSLKFVFSRKYFDHEFFFMIVDHSMEFYDPFNNEKIEGEVLKRMFLIDKKSFNEKKYTNLVIEYQLNKKKINEQDLLDYIIPKYKDIKSAKKYLNHQKNIQIRTATFEQRKLIITEKAIDFPLIINKKNIEKRCKSCDFKNNYENLTFFDSKMHNNFKEKEGKLLLSGRLKGLYKEGLRNINVKIYYPETLLQKLAEIISKNIYILEKGHDFNQQINYCISFILQILADFSCWVFPPLDPYPLETYQGKLGTNEIYMEVIKTNPITVAVLITEKKYKIYIVFESNQKIIDKCLVFKPLIKIILDFKNGSVYSFNQLPSLIVFNNNEGNLQMICQGELIGTNQENYTVCEIKVNEKSIQGKIFFKNYEKDKEFLKINGKWLREISINDLTMHVFKNKNDRILESVENLLPSDTSFREDLKMLERGEFEKTRKIYQRIECLKMISNISKNSLKLKKK